MDKYDIARTFTKLGKEPPEILLYDQLEELIPCIFLYVGYHVGHWCAILKHKDSWEIFDPIGLWPDSEIDHPAIRKVPKKFAELAAEKTRQGYRVDYNHFRLQKGGSTCGLWCIMRWLNKNLQCEEFIKEFEDVTDAEIAQYFSRPDLLK